MPQLEPIASKGWFEILRAGAIWGAIVDLAGSPLGQFIVFLWVLAPLFLYIAYAVARSSGSRLRLLHFSPRDFGWVVVSTIAFMFVLWLPVAGVSAAIFSFL